eukprot:366008-Chlamydomonas_euryale.AAC.12
MSLKGQSREPLSAWIQASIQPIYVFKRLIKGAFVGMDSRSQCQAVVCQLDQDWRAFPVCQGSCRLVQGLAGWLKVLPVGSGSCRLVQGLAGWGQRGQPTQRRFGPSTATCQGTT